LSGRKIAKPAAHHPESGDLGISIEPLAARTQLDWLTLTTSAPPSETLRRYRELQHSALGHWRFERALSARAPLLRALQIRFDELGVGLCRASMQPHRRVRAVDGCLDPVAIGALAHMTANMLVEISVPEGVLWTGRGLTIEHLRTTRSAVGALARLDKSDWGQAALVGIPVTLSDAIGTEVARAVVSVAVAARSG
jgi:acyl-coenzyme A thioesterase PaaI-like protein